MHPGELVVVVAVFIILNVYDSVQLLLLARTKEPVVVSWALHPHLLTPPTPPMPLTMSFQSPIPLIPRPPETAEISKLSKFLMAHLYVNLSFLSGDAAALSASGATFNSQHGVELLLRREPSPVAVPPAPAPAPIPKPFCVPAARRRPASDRL